MGWICASVYFFSLCHPVQPYASLWNELGSGLACRLLGLCIFAGWHAIGNLVKLMFFVTYLLIEIFCDSEDCYYSVYHDFSLVWHSSKHLARQAHITLLWLYLTWPFCYSSCQTSSAVQAVGKKRLKTAEGYFKPCDLFRFILHNYKSLFQNVNSP